MRLLSICGLLASLLSPSLCERRNTQVCSLDPGFECADGQYCAFLDGEAIGECKPAQCSTRHNSCPATTPLCDRGVCTACASDAQCLRVNPDAPICEASGRCVGCSEDRHCGDALAPICDAATRSCRPCRAHADCASGVCAKDDTFAGLSAPIRAGSCVDASRINVVPSSCTTPSCFNDLLVMAVSASKPYVLIKGSLLLSGTVVIPSLRADLPSYYIIGPTADTAPSALMNTSGLQLQRGGGTALSVTNGTTVTLEGVFIVRSNTGLDCVGSTTPTRVRLLRSLIGDNTTGISAAAQCELSIDSSWLGRGPEPQFSSILSNRQALRFDGSRLDVVNSVFWHNGAPGTLGGILITGSAPRVRIVNSSFVQHTTYDARNVLAIDCTNMTGGSMSIVNSLFLTESFSSLLGTTYVHPSCRPDGALYGTLSNEAALVDRSHSQNLADATLDYTLFVNQAKGDLHFADGAPSRVRKSGVTQVSDMQGPVPIPKRDIDGKMRGEAALSSGAFEANP